MGARRRGRERAVQILYEWAITGRDLDRLLDLFWRARDDRDDVRSFAELLVSGVAQGPDHLDSLINHQAENWRPERISTVDRSILRVGVYELLNQPDTPPAVVLDEAVELAKRFSAPEAGPFVNGVLDGIRRRLEQGKEAGSAGAAQGGESATEPDEPANDTMRAE